ncbi:hypothetical protein G4H71_16950 [Rhodococcus triatomae]|nr:hypothetical protein [Rhodococcus triatomae]QNG24502.1 hypothetical protein G4H71_16950 [Rhodococcus triatomae]
MARVVERAESDPPVWLPDGENTGPGTGGTDRRGTAGEETAANGRGDEEYYNPRSWLV